MSRLTMLSLAGSALIMMSSATHADVTAEDVWNDWKTYLGAMGYSVTGAESRDGATFVVHNVVLRSEGLEGAGAGQITMDQISFLERPGGTVDIILPDVMPLSFSAPNDSGGETTVFMEYRQSGMNLSASGTPTNLSYLTEADTITLVSTGYAIDGENLPNDSNQIEVAFQGLSGVTDMTLDSKRRYDQRLTVENVTYSMSVTEPENGTRIAIDGQTEALGFDGSSTLPLRVVQASDMDAMLSAGFEVNGTFRYGANSMKMMASGPEGPAALDARSDSGTLGVVMGQNGLIYEGTQSGTKAEMTMAQLPFPVSFEIARAAFNIAMPLRKSETPEDFALGLTLEGLSMSDILWGLFDPGAQLPRDPATLVIDLSGKARLLFDFLDPESAMVSANPDKAPAEIEKLDLNQLRIAVAGAELTGVGGFTFDNAQGPMPKPEGAVDLRLVGGNALIDRLVTIGLLPEEQAMGARMMMGLLAVPGDAPDTLNSKIEINEKGHISANGQRIQ